MRSWESNSRPLDRQSPVTTRPGLLLFNPENTHLLRKGKSHCTADLLFDWFGFSCFVELKL